MHTIPVTSIKGIGPVKGRVLQEEAGIVTVEDLLYYAPRRYLDRSSIKRIIDTFAEDEVTVAGTIVSVKIVPARRRMLRVEITDGTDTLAGIFFAGLSFFEKIFVPGEFILFSGVIKVFRGKQIVHPDFDFLDDNSEYKSINTGRIIPLYRSSETLRKSGFDSRGFRRLIRSALDLYREMITDPLDSNILKKYNMLPLKQAISGIHYPDTFEHIEKCRIRLAFNEVFFMQYYMAVSRIMISNRASKPSTGFDTGLLKAFIAELSFDLTGDQQKALEEITEDLGSTVPMNRLLQGDVGTGKTVIALASALIPVSAGRQAAIMVPTEILASQHYMTALKLLPPSVKCELLSGSMKKKEKDKVYASLSTGETHIVIGTHALIQSGLKFRDLAYIIIDEQHRFGVEQRAKLRSKGEDTDLLVMTATPIPRSLSMTLYADMDVSYLRQKPLNRNIIETLSFPESRIKGIYNSISRYISQGRQVFYVLPLIEESEKVDLKSAEETYVTLKENVFPQHRTALIHGRLSQNQKDEIMDLFRKGDIDILVSTTVIEVGIDIPNANVMVIHHAERFGLAQIHQLRGRVGRGEHKSFCILIHPDNISIEAQERIRILTENSDGFSISELDLKMRGSGQLVGTKQHGLSDFEFTDLARDMDIIKSAKKEVDQIIKKHPPINSETGKIDNPHISEFMKGLRSKRILEILS